MKKTENLSTTRTVATAPGLAMVTTRGLLLTVMLVMSVVFLSGCNLFSQSGTATSVADWSTQLAQNNTPLDDFPEFPELPSDASNLDETNNPETNNPGETNEGAEQPLVGSETDPTRTSANDHNNSVSFIMLDAWYRTYAHLPHAEREAKMMEYFNSTWRLYPDIATTFNHAAPGNGGKEIVGFTAQPFGTFRNNIGWSAFYNTYFNSTRQSFSQSNRVPGFRYNPWNINLTADQRHVGTFTFADGQVAYALIECFNILTERHVIRDVPRDDSHRPPGIPPGEGGETPQPQTVTVTVNNYVAQSGATQWTSAGTQTFTVNVGSSHTVPGTFSYGGHTHELIRVNDRDGARGQGFTVTVSGNMTLHAYYLRAADATPTPTPPGPTPPPQPQNVTVIMDHVYVSGGNYMLVPGTQRDSKTGPINRAMSFNLPRSNDYTISEVREYSSNGQTFIRRHNASGTSFSFTPTGNTLLRAVYVRNQPTTVTLTVNNYVAEQGTANWTRAGTTTHTIQVGGSHTIPGTLTHGGHAHELHNVDGTNVTRGQSHTISNITANRTVNAYYIRRPAAAQEWDVTVTIRLIDTMTHAVVETVSTQTIRTTNQSATFRIGDVGTGGAVGRVVLGPNERFHTFSGMTINGSSVGGHDSPPSGWTASGGSAMYTLNNVTGNTTVIVNYLRYVEQWQDVPPGNYPDHWGGTPGVDVPEEAGHPREYDFPSDPSLQPPPEEKGQDTPTELLPGGSGTGVDGDDPAGWH
ncbi:hypothetical protein FWH13_00270 [Candidatus Saccharibacteria bacterium]|nr:hypothetical protein [Candidatus Saccharibacteria bacterium]